MKSFSQQQQEQMRKQQEQMRQQQDNLRRQQMQWDWQQRQQAKAKAQPVVRSQASQPDRFAQVAPGASNSGYQYPAAEPAPRRFLGCVSLVVGLGITGSLGFLAGNFVVEATFNEAAAWAAAGIIWLFGLIVTISISRKIWHRD